jgi:predicted ATPase
VSRPSRKSGLPGTLNGGGIWCATTCSRRWGSPITTPRPAWPRRQHRTARELGERLLGLARSVGAPALLVQAHRALGEAFQNLGELVQARQHLTQGSALYESHQHRSRTFTDPGAFCLAFASWVLWPLGYPEQALARSQAALSLARELAYPHTLAAVQFFAAMVHKLRGERQLAQERAEAAIVLGREHGLPHWTMFGTIVRGWALAMQGQLEAGITEIQAGLAAQQVTGAGIARPSFLLLLAEAHAAAGETGAGLEALAVARRQEARAWELRAASSLSRLWRQQGKGIAAHDLLAPIYGWFSEGLDLADLREARRCWSS